MLRYKKPFKNGNCISILKIQNENVFLKNKWEITTDDSERL